MSRGCSVVVTKDQGYFFLYQSRAMPRGRSLDLRCLVDEKSTRSRTALISRSVKEASLSSFHRQQGDFMCRVPSPVRSSSRRMSIVSGTLRRRSRRVSFELSSSSVIRCPFQNLHPLPQPSLPRNSTLLRPVRRHPDLFPPPRAHNGSARVEPGRAWVRTRAVVR